MGSLTLPATGLVYLDANPIIYTVEKHPVYGPLLVPLWQAAQAQTIEVVSSELALMETLVGPLKRGDTALEKAYEQALLARTCASCPSPKWCCGKRLACALQPSSRLPMHCILPPLKA